MLFGSFNSSAGLPSLPMSKHFLVQIAHSLNGQDGVMRSTKEYRQSCSSPDIAARRALGLYRKETTRGKRGISYGIRVKPLGTF